MSGIVGSYFNTRGSGVVAKLGTDGQVFTSTGAGLSQGFEAAAGGGKIGQVLSAATTDTATYGTQTYADITGMTIAITPTATSSKILIMSDISIGITTGYGAMIRMMRDSTAIHVGVAAGSRQASTKASINYHSPMMQSYGSIYLDSPSTTSEITYKLQWLSETSGPIYRGRSATDNDVAYVARTADSITVMEVLA